MSATLLNDRYLKALQHDAIDTTPVWIMRQAGRYLPEYRATRTQAGSFMDLCKNPELACEVTLQPLERYDLDAAILFSDILTIPDAMGLGLYFEQGEGPRFKKPVRTVADIQALAVPDPNDELRYVMDAVSTIRQALAGRVPLIGFSGSPWTLATYMVEGSSSKDFAKVKGLMYENPQAMHQLLNTLAESVTVYLNAQIAAGAQAVQIFDTWGGSLTPAKYEEFSLRYMQQIVAGLTREAEGRKVPVILFTKGGGHWVNKIAASNCDAVGLDWTVNISDIRRKLQQDDIKVAVQGNLDPCVLYAPDDVIRTEVKRILDDHYEATGTNTGHVFNLGHGIHQFVAPEKVKVLVDAVHEFGRR